MSIKYGDFRRLLATNCNKNLPANLRVKHLKSWEILRLLKKRPVPCQDRPFDTWKSLFYSDALEDICPAALVAIGAVWSTVNVHFGVDHILTWR